MRMQKKQKRVFLLFAILFYIGMAFGLSAIILYRVISPAAILALYQMSGEDIFVTVFCGIFAISFTVFIVKSKRFRYYIEITQSEIAFFDGEKLYKYNMIDLQSYIITKKSFGFTEFKLLLTENRAIIINTNKAQDLRVILDKNIAERIGEEHAPH